MALWVVLSRDLPSALTLPEVMWQSVDLGKRIRFGIGYGLPVEQVLYGALHVFLVLTIFGFIPRTASFFSGLLLYHFAPFETIFWTPNPYLRGLTFSTLGLLLISFSPDSSRATLRSLAPVARWPIALMQIIVAQMYFFAGYAKLMNSGLAWASEENVRRSLFLLEQAYGIGDGLPLGYRVAALHGIPALIGWTAIAFELIFPLAIVSRRARNVIVPAAVLFHLGNVALFHIVFQELPALLLFVDWGKPAATTEHAVRLIGPQEDATA